MEQILSPLAEYGIIGVVIAYLLYSNSKKDMRIDVLTDKLVTKNSDDAERFTKITLTMERILIAVGDGK